MLDSNGFDMWADIYDDNVGAADEENKYPFAGYKNVINFIFSSIMKKKHADVLDIGFGTGVLTAKLYENGCNIYGQDFSEEMLRISKEKMPNAKLYIGDFSHGIRKELTVRKYDAIILTYSIHHITSKNKLELIEALLPLLNDGGKIYIGDVMFESTGEMEKCAHECGDEWDDDEIYLVIDEMKSIFPCKFEFIKMSYCAGVVIVENGSNMREQG